MAPYIYTPLKYDADFCLLIGANPKAKYKKKDIFDLLISHAEKTNKYYLFRGDLKNFLQKIHHSGWHGYTKATLMLILNSLMTLSGVDLSNKYVIISANKSTLPVSVIEVEL